MKTMKRIVIVTGAALALAACGADPSEHPARDLEPVAVTVTESWTAAAQATHPARVVSQQEAEVATRMAGTVARMAVQVGDRVARGDLIASLDGTDVNARIEAARAQRELAERTFQRVENLERDGAASTQELDQARAQRTAARAMVQEAEAQAAYVRIRAPFAGTVTARMADAGDLAAPGSPLVRLSGDALKVVAELPAELAGSIAVGEEVLLETDRGVRTGTVRNVVQALDRASRRFQVEVIPEGFEGLLPGAFLRLTVPEGAAATRWIPADAVVRNGQLTGVFTLDDELLRLRWIRLGRTRGDAVEVLSGPAGTLTVVREPAAGLEDGQPVSGVTRAPATAAALEAAPAATSPSTPGQEG
jgi:RND family efflux transporter MFP subunit